MTILKLKSFIKNATGIDWQFPPLNQDVALPIYLRNLYDFYLTEVSDQKVVFTIFQTDKTIPSISDIKNHLKVIEKNYCARPILVFERRAPKRLALLVKNKIPYIYIGKEIYLPFLMLKLAQPRNQNLNIQHKEIPSAAQIILIAQLIHGNLDGLSVSDIAKKLTLPKSTISRALCMIENESLCHSMSEGKNKRYHFIKRDDLWTLAYSFLTCPSVKEVFVNHIPTGINLIKSGVSALAEKTLLDDQGKLSFAMSRKQFESIDIEDRADPTITLEIWAWDPGITSLNGVTDPITTYLCLRSNDDERVKIARDEYLASIGLKPIH